MNDFKAGDRVEYVGLHASFNTTDNIGIKSVIIKRNGDTTRVKWDDDREFSVFHGNIRLLVTPDAITIIRADLPEVTERDGKFWAGSGPEECMARGSENPNWLRNHANSALALAEFLEARDKAAEEAAAAEKEAADKLNKRRDELANEFYLAAIGADDGGGYKKRNPITRAAINRVIELEANRG